MTKADIVQRVQQNVGGHRVECIEMVETMLKVIKDTLESGERLMISGFGNFEVRRKKPRLGRNPQTGEDMTITARKIVTFKPSVILRKNINGNA